MILIANAPLSKIGFAKDAANCHISQAPGLTKITRTKVCAPGNQVVYMCQQLGDCQLATFFLLHTYLYPMPVVWDFYTLAAPVHGADCYTLGIAIG